MKKAAVFVALLALAPVAPARANVEQKLDQLIEKQNQILQKLDEMKLELQVVKVRATQK